MAFYGSTFVFDGVPCEEYGLMIYDFQSKEQGDGKITSVGSIISDSVPSKRTKYLYGISQDEPLEFTLIFGAIPNTRQDNYLDRWEIDAISTWLTGHNTYRYLEICQPDLDFYRYKCIAKSLDIITYGSLPWAFSCVFQCDGPFAYEFPERVTFQVPSSLTVNLVNRSSLRGYYYPNIVVGLSGGTNFEIVNHSDSDRKFAFSNLPSGNLLTLNIDNENAVITSSIDSINPYSYFNFNFFRMIRGDNKITIKGNATVSFLYEFPINVGG